MSEFTHVIYHSADLDGHCSGALAMLRNPAAVPVPWNYGEPVPDIPDGSRVFMADICFEPFDVMVELARRMERFVWIDHHKTSIEACAAAGCEIEGARAEKWAACELTWLWLNAEASADGEDIFDKISQMPLWVRLLGRWDVWDHDAEGVVRQFQFGMRSFETDPAVLPWRGRLLNARNVWVDLGRREICYEAVSERGFVLVEAADKQNRMIGDRAAFETTFRAADGREYPVLAWNAPLGGSDPGEHLRGPEHAFLVRFGYSGKTGQWDFSLYGNDFYLGDSPDCGAIAKGFGGGGHVNAAGFAVPVGRWPLSVNVGA